MVTAMSADVFSRFWRGSEMNILANVLALNAHRLSEPWTSSKDFNIRKLQIKCQKCISGCHRYYCNLFHHNIRLDSPQEWFKQNPAENQLFENRPIVLWSCKLFSTWDSPAFQHTAATTSVSIWSVFTVSFCAPSPLCCLTVYRSGLSIKLEQFLAFLM